MNAAKNFIGGRNLSDAWARALIRCHAVAGGVIAPAVVEFPAPATDMGIEDKRIREVVDDYLRRLPKQQKIETIAGTIFPESIWALARNDRKKFFETYKKCIPRILRYCDNANGVYFARMIEYPSRERRTINQLEKIIEIWKSGNHRHSALQAGIYCPGEDLKNQRQRGFPCLQQLAFYAEGQNGCHGLSLVAFYANQNLIEKGYGNYLGLYRLGEFMAHEMELNLSKIVCIASALRLGKQAKIRSKQLVEKIKVLINEEVE